VVHGRWFSPGTPASSTTKTGRHDIADVLLKVALSTNNHYILFIIVYVLHTHEQFENAQVHESVDIM
jgi:hypothetical protein